MGDYAAGLESAKLALSIRRRVFGEEHLSTADIYHSLGDTQRALGDFPSFSDNTSAYSSNCSCRLDFYHSPVSGLRFLPEREGRNAVGSLSCMISDW